MTGDEFVATFLLFTCWLFGLLPPTADGKFRNMSNTKFMFGFIYAPMMISMIIAKLLF